MDKKHYLEAGIIINTHGVNGEIKIESWTDDPSVLTTLDVIYIDGIAKKITSSRVHKSFLLMSLDDVYNFEEAKKLKNKIIYINRNDIKLKAGRYFIVDLIGLRAINNDNDEDIGFIDEILTLPYNNVYVIKADPHSSKEILVPAAPEFIKEINIQSGYIKFKLIDGM